MLDPDAAASWARTARAWARILELIPSRLDIIRLSDVGYWMAGPVPPFTSILIYSGPQVHLGMQFLVGPPKVFNYVCIYQSLMGDTSSIATHPGVYKVRLRRQVQSAIRVGTA